MAKPEDLTDLERRLVECAQAGELLDLADGADIDPDEMEHWGPDRTVRADVLRDLLLRRHGWQPDPRGVRLRGAAVADDLDLAGVHADVVLSLVECRIPAIDLSRARLPDLTLAGVVTTQLTAVRLQVDHEVSLGRLRISSDGDGYGVVQLAGARIGGDLTCFGADLTNPAGPALNASGIQVGGDVYLTAEFRASGGDSLGTIRFDGGHIGGALYCNGAQLTNTSGPALDISQLRTDGNVILVGGFRATGTGASGAVELAGTHIGGDLLYNGAQLTNTDGPALNVVDLALDGEIVLIEGFHATGAGRFGTVRLHNVRVGGQLGCIEGTIDHHDGGDELDLSQSAVGGLFLSAGFADHIDLDGLRYEGIPAGASVDDWLRWLRDPEGTYSAQAYQRLAAVHRAAGHERDARRILIEQQRDLLRRGGLSRWQRVRHRVLGATLGYGYQSWRALAALVITLVLATGLTIAAGAKGVAVHTRDYQPGTHCSLVEQVGLGVDLAAPLISTGARTRCEVVTTSHPGQVLTAAGWVFQLAAWAFATLFIAGFTGVIRKQ